jgi:hypothetical protein
LTVFFLFFFLFHEKSVPLSLSSMQRAFSVCVFLLPFLCCCAKKSNIRQHLLFMKIVPTHFLLFFHFSNSFLYYIKIENYIFLYTNSSTNLI